MQRELPQAKKRDKVKVAATTKGIKKFSSIIYLGIGFTMYDTNELYFVTCERKIPQVG
jgi:hypothetical protein